MSTASTVGTVGTVSGALHAGRRRTAVVTFVLAGAAVALLVASVALGRFAVPATDVVVALLGGPTSPAAALVVDLRAPRAVVGLLAGAAFGLSGAMYQSVARNVLASPDVIGVTAGASAAAVAAIVTGAPHVLLGPAALVGALVVAVVVDVLARRSGASPVRVVLVGIGVSAFLAAVTTLMLVRARLDDALQATVWLTGSLAGQGWADAGWLLAGLAVATPLLVAGRRDLRALQLGDDLARSTGLDVVTRRRAQLALATVLAATATAAVGPVAFVAFMAAPLARRLVRSPLALGASALTGAVLVTGADLVGRFAFGPVGLPVGVVTGILGAPYLLWLLARSSTTPGEL